MAKLRYKILEEDLNEIIENSISLGYLTNKLYHETNLENRKNLGKRIIQKTNFHESKLPKNSKDKLILPFSILYINEYCNKLK